MVQEVRTLAKCAEIGVPAPCVYLADFASSRIYMQHFITATTVRDLLFSAPSPGVTTHIIIHLRYHMSPAEVLSKTMRDIGTTIVCSANSHLDVCYSRHRPSCTVVTLYTAI